MVMAQSITSGLQLLNTQKCSGLSKLVTKIARKAANIQIQQNKQRNIHLKLFPKLNANPQTDSSQINSIHSSTECKPTN